MLFPTTKSISPQWLEAQLSGIAPVYPSTRVWERRIRMMEEEEEEAGRKEGRGQWEEWGGQRRGEANSAEEGCVPLVFLEVHTGALHSTNLGSARFTQAQRLSVWTCGTMLYA